MRYYDSHINWISDTEYALIIGAVVGRVPYIPPNTWMYSVRVYLLFFKIELVLITGESNVESTT